VAKLIAKLSEQRRHQIMLEIRETNLDGQFFFRANGFQAVSVARQFYADTGEDAYVMRYRHRADNVR
jgi:ribosomal-protein-alanine N-acetyltransferase